jgi:hypothetical protein
LNLLCSLGRHRPRGIPRWNDGFYFATCERCGCDLVRTAFQRWHVPKGYRVVWSDRPPESRPEVALHPEENRPPPEAQAEPAQPLDRGAASAIFVPEPLPDAVSAPAAPAPAELPVEAPAAPAEPEAAYEQVPAEAVVPPAGPVNGRLPIQDVLAQLNAEDAAKRSREAAPPPEEAQARRQRTTWDFMDEDPSKGDSATDLAWGRVPALPAAPEAAPSSSPENDYVEASSRRVGGLPERWRSVRSAVRNFWSGPAEPNPVLVIALALAVAVAVAVGLALFSTGPTSPGPTASSGSGAGEVGEASNPFAADATDISGSEPEMPRSREPMSDSDAPPGDRAYVAASLLSCREAPVLQARRVRNLARGQEVRVLGYEGDWASLAYRGGQCWARGDFISPVPPLEER